MYGSQEYGSIPYGDIIAIIEQIIVTLNSIEALFREPYKQTEFISERKKDVFRSEDFRRR